MNGSKYGLKKNKTLVYSKQLIFSLKALAFKPPSKVYLCFERLKSKYKNYSQGFANFLEYFEYTWMNGMFQIKDWNYHDKINQFEDLAVTNNGLESFHQMIRSQLRRNKPSQHGLFDVLSRVELIKQIDYESDKVKGDPTFNR